MDQRPYSKTEIPPSVVVHSFISFYRHNLNGLPYVGESHDFPEIIYAEKGDVPLSIDGQSITLSEGQIIICAPNVFHGGSGVMHTMLDNIGFEVESELILPLYNQAITLSINQKLTLERIIVNGSKLFRRTGRDNPFRGMVLCDNVNPCDLQRLKNQLELFLLDLFDVKIHSPKKSNIQDFVVICAYIDDHLDCSLTLEHLASLIGISVSKLKQLFHEHTGMGASTYITKCRIEAAKKLISTNRMNFSQIASHVGLGTVHYFSRVFKKQTGMTPSEYRRNQNL